MTNLQIDQIRSFGRHRSIDNEAITRLADSISKIGLQTPITVTKTPVGDYRLVAGAHRLKACQSLGLVDIAAEVVDWDDDQLEMWEISENLHRAELTKLERAEHIDRWRELLKIREGAQLAHPGGKQPSNQGVSVTARELGVSRREVERSREIAGLSEDAKEAARETGLENNQSALQKVAKEPKKKQKAKVYNLANLRKGNIPDQDVNRSMQWRGRFQRFWDNAPDQTDKEWALSYVMDIAPVFDNTKAGQG